MGAQVLLKCLHCFTEVGFIVHDHYALADRNAGREFHDGFRKDACQACAFLLTVEDILDVAGRVQDCVGVGVQSVFIRGAVERIGKPIGADLLYKFACAYDFLQLVGLKDKVLNTLHGCSV